MVAGIYVFGTLGINLCYHRLLTHRGFTCPKWLEHYLAAARRLLVPGHAGALGRGPPPPSRAFRRAAGPAQPAGQLPVGACRLDPGEIGRHGAHADLCALRQGHHPRPVLQAGSTGRASISASCWHPGRCSSAPASPACWLPGGTLGGGGAVRPQPAGVGRLRAHGGRLAHHLVGQFGRPHVGLPQLRDRRGEPQQHLRRHHQQRGGLAQQPPCRSALGPPWPPVVGNRRDLSVAEWRLAGRRAVPARSPSRAYAKREATPYSTTDGRERALRSNLAAGRLLRTAIRIASTPSRRGGQKAHLCRTRRIRALTSAHWEDTSGNGQAHRLINSFARNVPWPFRSQSASAAGASH